MEIEKVVLKYVFLVIVVVTIGVTLTQISFYIKTYYKEKQAMDKGYVEEVVTKIPYRTIWVKDNKVLR